MTKNALRRALAAITLGAIMTAGSTAVAKADPLDNVTAYNAPIICEFLDKYPTVAGVESVVVVLAAKGFNQHEWAYILGNSVIHWCPYHQPEVRGFIAKYDKKMGV